MKCHTHMDKDAIGVCRICNMGVCNDCSKIINNSIMCKDCYQNLLHKGDLKKIVNFDSKADYNYINMFGINISINILMLVMVIMYFFTEIPIVDLLFIVLLIILTYTILNKWKYERALLSELLKQQK